MNILGMGPLEILMIALVAFILLGPQKMIDAARLLGKATKEVRRMTDELPKIVLDEEQGGPAQASSTPVSSQGDQQATGNTNESESEEAIADGPVAFRPPPNRTDPGKTQRTQDQDT